MITRQIQNLLQRSTPSTIETLQKLQALLLKTSLDHHEYLFSKLILSTVSFSVQHARKLFDDSPITPPPLFSYNTLIRAYSKSPVAPIESIRLFVALLRTPGAPRPDKFTYPFVIKACGLCSLLGVGGSVHSLVLKDGFGLDSHVSNTLVTMYGGCGAVGFARRVFDEISERDVVSWSSMIGAYVDSGLDSDALRVFKDMNKENVKPNSVTCVSLLVACTNLLNVRLGKSVHSYIHTSGTEMHVGLGTALLSMYAKSGHLDEASHIFNSISGKNLQSWTVMISCLADNGHGEEALSLFARMEEVGLTPDSVSFSAILSACSHSGLLHEGQELFEKMVNVYRVKPTMEHYGCMVDLFGRAGKIEEAYQIILSMPMEPNSVTLRSYLSACKHHGRALYLDKHLMQLLIEKEPDIGANYVLAANVSTITDGNGLGKMRGDMKMKGLKKVPGCSWVQTPDGGMKGIGGELIR